MAKSRGVSKGREALSQSINELAKVWATRAPMVGPMEVFEDLIDEYVVHMSGEEIETTKAIDSAVQFLTALRATVAAQSGFKS